MAAILMFTVFMEYDSNDRAVCADHSLRVCGICHVDSKFGDEGDSDEDKDKDGEEGEEEEDRMFILGTGVNRFMPQWDEEVNGPANTYQIWENYENPPKPERPDGLSFRHCEECQLIWLIGKEGADAAKSHPSHHTLDHIYAGTRRSLVVFIDGACPSNGPAATRSSIGLFFGLYSTYNVSRLLDEPQPTSQRAELLAAINAMRHVRQVIQPDRCSMVQLGARNQSKEVVQDARRFRLILATDSSYLVECVCKHIKRWTLSYADGDGQTKVYKNARQQVMKNTDLFLALEHEIERLSRVGVQVA